MRVTRIQVRGEVWEVPRGFGSHYLDIVEREEDVRASLNDLLGLVGYTASPETIAKWPLRRVVEAWAYAGRCHLKAGDNVLQGHPQPEWMGDPWQGPEEGDPDSVWCTPGPTVLT